MNHVVVNAEDARRARWHVRTEEGDDIPAVLVGRARFERLQKLVERIADTAGALGSWRAAGDLDGAILGILEALDTLQPGDLDPLP